MGYWIAQILRSKMEREIGGHWTYYQADDFRESQRWYVSDGTITFHHLGEYVVWERQRRIAKGLVVVE